MILEIIIACLGLASTAAAWFWNPKRKLYAEIDQVLEEMEQLHEEIGEALRLNNGVTLTILTARLVRLKDRYRVLFYRI